MSEEFQTKVSDGTLHIHINMPRLDASSATELKKQVLFELDPAVRCAEVEMGNVQFIDSSGVGILLSIYRKLPQDGPQVTLRNVQSGVRAVLELLRLHRVFTIE